MVISSTRSLGLQKYYEPHLVGHFSTLFTSKHHIALIIIHWFAKQQRNIILSNLISHSKPFQSPNAKPRTKQHKQKQEISINSSCIGYVNSCTYDSVPLELQDCAKITNHIWGDLIIGSNNQHIVADNDTWFCISKKYTVPCKLILISKFHQTQNRPPIFLHVLKLTAHTVPHPKVSKTKGSAQI